MTIGRICQREVDLADADEKVRAAAERMHQRRVGSLVILNTKKEPVGLITDRDLVLRVIATGRDPGATPIREVMSQPLTTIQEETPLEDAISLMRSGAFRRLPVVDRKGALVGVVTLDDILRLLSEELTGIGGLLEHEKPSASTAV